MRIFISALEPSSNIHLNEVLKRLATTDSKDSNIEICGIYDENLADSYPFVAPPLFKLSDFSVMAFVDVIKKIFFFKRALKAAYALAKTCDKVLLMDSSSFHIPLAKMLRKHGYNGVLAYYILPQIWAWKRYRKKILVELFDYLLGILPFEAAFYNSPKFEFVGHPLLDELPLDFADSKDFNERKFVAFMPGSRKREIKNLMPYFGAVAKKIDAPKILIAPKFFEKLSSDELRGIYGENLVLFELRFDAPSALLASKFAFICSGTATLESALLGTPLVLAYKMNALEFAILRKIVGKNLSHIGLANIFYHAMLTGSPNAVVTKSPRSKSKNKSSFLQSESAKNEPSSFRSESQNEPLLFRSETQNEPFSLHPELIQRDSDAEQDMFLLDSKPTQNAPFSLHPELIQRDLSVESLLSAYRDFNDVEKSARFSTNAKTLRNYLSHGSSARIAEILLRV